MAIAAVTVAVILVIALRYGALVERLVASPSEEVLLLKVLGLTVLVAGVVLPVIGPQRATPYLADAWNEGGSTLGGHPQWIQEADHVDCAACGEPMDYLGLVGGSDPGFGEGTYYLQLHAVCGLAAVCYQQS